MTHQCDRTPNPAECIAQVDRGVHDQRLQGDQGLRFGFHSAIAGDFDVRDHLRNAGLGLGLRRCLAIQDRPGCSLGIETVRFAMEIPQLPVGTHHIQNRMALGDEFPARACAVETGALDPEGSDGTEVPRPTFEFAISCAAGRNGPVAQPRTTRIDGDGDVVGLVRVDADNDFIYK